MKWVDFDIHGLVGIRLIDPPPRVEAAAERNLSSLRAALLREPDVTVRFVKKLPAPSLLIPGQRKYGLANNAFFIFMDQPQGAKVQIPFDRLGSPCEIVCEDGIEEVPLLVDLIRALALNKDCAPIHGSAFLYKEESFLVTSWAKGGKTTAMLGFLSLGAKFVADDCVLLSGDGQSMYGLPTALEVSGRHLSAMPSLRDKMNLRERVQMEAMGRLRKTRNTWMSLVSPRGATQRVWNKVVPALRGRWSVLIPVHKAFGNNMELRAPAPGKIFVLARHESPTITVAPARP
jgi:hypothetical protein